MTKDQTEALAFFKSYISATVVHVTLDIQVPVFTYMF